MGYVFISYSSKDLEYANVLRKVFTDNGIDTWMAPQDIPVGSTYSGVIVRAIKGADCLALLLTNHSQTSIWVDKEVERALANGKTIVPIAIEDIKLNDNFEFYLGNQQVVPVKQLSDTNEELVAIIDRVRNLMKTNTGHQQLRADYDEHNSIFSCDKRESERSNWIRSTRNAILKINRGVGKEQLAFLVSSTGIALTTLYGMLDNKGVLVDNITATLSIQSFCNELYEVSIPAKIVKINSTLMTAIIKIDTQNENLRQALLASKQIELPYLNIATDESALKCITLSSKMVIGFPHNSLVIGNKSYTLFEIKDTAFGYEASGAPIILEQSKQVIGVLRSLSKEVPKEQILGGYPSKIDPIHFYWEDIVR